MKVVIEIERGCRYKNELKDGVIVAREKMKKPMRFAYGYIPETWQGDNLELDAYFICKGKAKAGSIEIGEPIAIIEVDDGGLVDNKIVVCCHLWRGDKEKAIRQIVRACRNKPGATVKKVRDKCAAMQEISRCKTLYKAMFKKYE